MPLDFNLTREGISLNGGTRSVEELQLFIEKLQIMTQHIPGIWLRDSDTQPKAGDAKQGSARE